MGGAGGRAGEGRRVKKTFPHSSIIIFKVFCDESRDGRKGDRDRGMWEGKDKGGGRAVMQVSGVTAGGGDERAGT